MSGWTIETLKEHFEALREADKEAVKAALAAAERAVEKAEANAEKWRENANEWRGAMNDRERNLMPRAEAEKSIKANAEKIDGLETRIERSEGRSGGLNAGWAYLLAAIGMLATIVSIVMALWRK